MNYVFMKAFINTSVRSQSTFFDLTQVGQVVSNRLDLSRSSTWKRLGQKSISIDYQGFRLDTTY